MTTSLRRRRGRRGFGHRTGARAPRSHGRGPRVMLIRGRRRPGRGAPRWPGAVVGRPAAEGCVRLSKRARRSSEERSMGARRRAARSVDELPRASFAPQARRGSPPAPCRCRRSRDRSCRRWRSTSGSAVAALRRCEGDALIAGSSSAGRGPRPYDEAPPSISRRYRARFFSFSPRRFARRPNPARRWLAPRTRANEARLRA